MNDRLRSGDDIEMLMYQRGSPFRERRQSSLWRSHAPRSPDV